MYSIRAYKEVSQEVPLPGALSDSLLWYSLFVVRRLLSMVFIDTGQSDWTIGRGIFPTLIQIKN